MLLKDIRQNLWPVGLALLFPLLAFLASLFRIGWGSTSPAWVAEGLFVGNDMLVIPLIAFMTGNVLFRSEHWALIWTFPVGRFRVLLFKHLAGSVLVCTAWGLSALVLLGTHEAIPRGVPGWTYAVILASLYFLGVWVALATEAFSRGLVLLAAGLTAGFLADGFLGFRDSLSRAVLLIGPGILAILAVFLLLGLVVSTTALFLSCRLFAPVRNALIATGLLLSAGLAAVVGTTALASRSLRVTDLGRFNPYSVQLAGPRELLVQGGHRMFTGAWSRYGALFHETPAVLLFGPDNAFRQILPGIAPNAVRASEDGSCLAATYHHPQAEAWLLSIFERSGRELKRIHLGSRAQIDWCPGTHELVVMDSRCLFRVNAETGRIVPVPLPAMPTCGARAHGFHLATKGLLYFRIFGEDAFEAHRLADLEGRWTLAFTEGRPGSGPYGQPLACGDVMTRSGPESASLQTPDERILFDLSGPQVRVHREPWGITSQGSFRTGAFASPVGVLVSLSETKALALKPWGGGDPLWRIDFPYEFRDAFVWREQALVIGARPLDGDARQGRLILFRLDLTTGRLMELTAGNEAAIRSDLSWGPAFCDVEGPRAIFEVFGAPESRWKWFRVDLQAGTVEKVYSAEREE